MWKGVGVGEEVDNTKGREAALVGRGECRVVEGVGKRESGQIKGQHRGSPTELTRGQAVISRVLG